MRIIECYIENFGKLSGYTHKFKSGLNLILAENGWGKTTLAAFIKAMFYGLGAERKMSLDENERKKYIPWQGGRYGGSLTFERGGRTYRIERSFGARAADDVFRLVDAESGAGSADYGENIGLELFDIDAAGFERTVFLSEKNISGAINNDSISAKLSDLVGTTGDAGAVSEALSRLEERRKYYQKRGNTGEIAIIKSRISECNFAIDRLQRCKGELDEKEAQLNELSRNIKSMEAERAAAQDELTKAQGANEARSYREGYDRMRAELIKEQAEYEQLKQFFRDGAPTHLEIDEARDAARDARALREARQSFDTPELAELRIFFTRKTDFSEIERIKQLYRAKGDAEAEAEAISKNSAFAEEALKEDLGGRLPSPNELVDSAAPLGRPAQLTSAALCIAAVLLLALSFAITPYLLIAAIPTVVAAAALTAYTLLRLIRSKGSAAKLGIAVSGPAELEKLRERLEAHEHAKRRDAERAAALANEINDHERRIRDFTSAYPHGAADLGDAIEIIEAGFRRYYTLLEVSRESESSRASADIRIEHLESKVRAFTLAYPTDAPDPIEDVRSKLNSYLYYRRTLAKREDDLAEFARMHGIDDTKLAEDAEVKNVAAISERIGELDDSILAARRAHALRESEYTSLISELERMDQLCAERDAYEEKLNESIKSLEVIKATMSLLSEASEAMTSRYVGGTKAKFEHYLGYIGDEGEFSMGTDFVAKKHERGETRAPESYSRGTRDLRAFCLRLALSDSLWGGDLPFVMLDDPFASLDNDRLEGAKALISSLAREKQVIYFTCSRERTI